MGASAKFRKALTTQQQRRLLVASETAEAVLVGEGPFGDGSPHEVWLVDTAIGRILFLVPGLVESDPPEVRDAIAARREASIRGRCPTCGARRRLRAGRLDFRHENWCGAGDERLGELIARHQGGAA